MSLRDLIPILQSAIGPVILFSGVGLLLLSMTNRFGRVIDRARLLTRELRTVEPALHDRTVAQLRILMRRARIIRAAIALGALSVLLAALLIIVLFLEALLHYDAALPISGLFIGCMLCVIASLLLFLGDINLSLTALKFEVGALDDAHSGNPTTSR